MANRIDDDWESLVRDLATRVDAFAPGWTDHRDTDPGITIVQLFAFLTESLLDRGNASSRARSRLRDVLKDLDADAAVPCGDPPLRNRYFIGKLLSVDDLETEQDYLRNKHRRHNLHLHGVGIVRGLAVSVEPSGARPIVTVSAGVAIGPDGEELLVCAAQTSRGRSGRSPCYVTVRLVDRPVEPVPSGVVADGEASRIEEHAEVAVPSQVPQGHLAIGRLERVDGAWRVDASFKPKRVDR